MTETVYLFVYRVTYCWLFSFTRNVEIRISGCPEINDAAQVKAAERYIRNGLFSKPDKTGNIRQYKKHPFSTGVTVINYIPLQRVPVLKNPE